MRMGRAIAAAAGIGFAPVRALAAGFDPDHAAQAYFALLDPAARARSDAYFDGRLWIDAGSALISVAIALVVLRSGVLVRCRDALRRQGWRPWVVMLAVAGLFIVCTTLLALPWTIYTDFWRERAYGLLNQSFGGWLGEEAIGFALTLVAGSVLAVAINAVMRAAPRGWWLAGTAIIGLFVFVFALLVPVFVAPLFNTYAPLPQGALRTRIEAMAATEHIPADQLLVYDASRQSSRISAHVAGFGPTVQIALTDTLVRGVSVNDAAAVVGHEMGHYVLHHVWESVVEITLLAAFELWLIARIGPWLIGSGLVGRGLRGLDDPAALPVLVGLYTLLSLLLLPVSNTLTRIQESAADAFGLELAREPDGFAHTAMVLASYRKIAPPAWEEVLFYDHPSGRTRVLMAMRWKRDHVPGAPEVVPAPLPR